MDKVEVKRVRQVRSQRDWESIIGNWSHSGKSMAAFCKEEGLGLSTFQRYRSLFRDSGVQAAGTTLGTARFIELGSLQESHTSERDKARPASTGCVSLRLDLGGGVTLTLEHR